MASNTMKLADKAEFQLVTTQAEADALTTILACAGVVAIDTEADSMYHYHTHLCLLQMTLADANEKLIGTWIVDPLQGLDLSGMFERLSAVPVILFHAADYDLRLLRKFYGWRPREIFDTMLAARLIGELQFGLAALTETFLGVVLPKEYQRYNWSLRPLKKEVLTYAANDTIYVFKLYPILRQKLAEMNRTEWHRQMCAHFISEAWADVPTAPDPETCWRIKGWQSVETDKGLAVLSALWAWREKYAEKMDRPAFKVMTNENLIALVHWEETPASQRVARLSLPKNIVGGIYRDLQRSLAKAAALSPSKYPKRKLRSKGTRLSENACLVMNHLRKKRLEWAERIGLDPGFALPNGTLESIVRCNPSNVDDLHNCTGVMPWQTDLWGTAILDEIRKTTEENKKAS